MYMNIVNELIKLETKIFKNKYGLELMMGIIEINGRKYIPHFSTSFLTFNKLDEIFTETDSRTRSKIWSKKQEKTKKLIISCIDNSEYKTRIVEGKDLLVIDKINDKEIFDKYYELYSECFEYNFGYSLGTSRPKDVLLLDLEAFRILCTQFRFSDRNSKGTYRQKVRERAIYFESVEVFVKEFFNEDILVHDWLYITPQQVKHFMDTKEIIINKLVDIHGDLYKGDNDYKSKFGMFFSDSDLRDNEIKKLIQFYIEDVFCSDSILSYYKITYKSYTGFLEMARQINEKEINYKDFLLGLVDIYKTVKRIAKYSGKKIYEHYCVENNIIGKELESTMEVEKVFREIDDTEKKFNGSSLRKRVINVIEYNSNFYKEYDLMEREVFEDKYKKSVVYHFMSEIKKYHNLLRDFYSFTYDLNRKNEKEEKINMSFNHYLKFHRQYNYTFFKEYNEDMLNSRNNGLIDSFDYTVNMIFLKEEFMANKRWFEKLSKNEYMKLRSEVITRRQKLIRLSEITDEYMEDPATLTTVPLARREDISYLFLSGRKEYKTKPRHINRLLEED